MLDTESSLRLRLLRFPLVLGVVFIHAHGAAVEFSGGVIGSGGDSFASAFIRHLISQGLARTAVPLFFLMSGFFYFTGFQGTLTEYAHKLGTRVRTLLTPYLFWNLLTLLLVATALSLPQTRGFFSGRGSYLADLSLTSCAAAVLGIGRSPIAFQFWFIRDLMLLAVLAPAIGLLAKHAPLLLLPVAFLAWFFDFWPDLPPAAEAFCFFATGAVLALRGISPFCLDRFGKILFLAYACVLVLDAGLMQGSANLWTRRVGVVLGCASVLYATRFLAARARSRDLLAALSGASFFVFAAHEPLLTVIKKLTYRALVPESDVMVLLLYFALPLLVILLCLGAHRLLSAMFPRFCGVITGGRA